MNKDEKRNPNEPATGSDRTSAKEVAHEAGLTDNYGVKKANARVIYNQIGVSFLFAISLKYSYSQNVSSLFI